MTTDEMAGLLDRIADAMDDLASQDAPRTGREDADFHLGAGLVSEYEVALMGLGYIGGMVDASVVVASGGDAGDVADFCRDAMAAMVDVLASSKLEVADGGGAR